MKLILDRLSGKLVSDKPGTVQLQHLPEGHSAMIAVEYVQARMGHCNIRTTLQYLNYKSRLQWRSKIQHEYESNLMQYVMSSVNSAGELS